MYPHPHLYLEKSLPFLSSSLTYATTVTYQILPDRRQCEHPYHRRPAGHWYLARDLVPGVPGWETATESVGDYSGGKVLSKNRCRAQQA